MATRIALKNFFLRGLKPTQGQFATLIDSCWNKTDDTIGITDVSGLTAALGSKGSVDQVNNALTVANEALAQSIPAGGETGEFLVKASDDDYDTEWVPSAFDMTAFIAAAQTLDTEADAVAAGLAPYTFYKTSTGELRYKLPDGRVFSPEFNPIFS